ncbi:MAG TPA: hypothetical protein DEA08_19280, partial [Planctomycetes bacterium]|nr:hypothetical protein [Planctomycetota bacterium]
MSNRSIHPTLRTGLLALLACGALGLSGCVVRARTPGVSASVTFRHGHARHVCGGGCSHYRPRARAPRRPAVRVYAHGHRSHVCKSGCRYWR